MDLVPGGLTYQVRETLFRLWKIKLPHSGGASRDNHRAKNSKDLLLLSSGPLSFKTAQRIGLMLQEKKKIQPTIKKLQGGDPELQKRMQPRHSFDCFLVRLWAKDPVYLYHNSAIIKKKKTTNRYLCTHFESFCTEQAVFILWSIFLKHPCQGQCQNVRSKHAYYTLISRIL